MSQKHPAAAVLALSLAFCGMPANADLYEAEAAFGKQEFERAFALYRELGELGQLNAQETLALMYVNGEGVKRDNVLGYAWAKLALEQGKNDAMQSIVDQLEPHMTEAARKRVADLQSQFGQDALRARLIPVDLSDGVRPQCTVVTPANPIEYYPKYALEKKIPGDVILDFTVQPDGRVRDVRVVHATMLFVFDHAARYVVMNTRFKPQVLNGIAVPCALRLKVKFHLRSPSNDVIAEKFGGTKLKAEAGDPEAQFVYGVLVMSRADLNVARDDSLPWLVKAAQAGLGRAQYFVGMAALSGAVAEHDPAKGVIWLRKSADSGLPDAQVVLANYIVSSRTDADASAEARKLFERAIVAGSVEAKYRLAGLLASAPDSAQRDPARALALLDEVDVLFQFDPSLFEVRAAALAWQGDFEGAIRNQKLALGRAKRLSWNMASQEARLADYEAKKTVTGTLFTW